MTSWEGEKQKVARAAGVVGAATLASRVGGFVRDLVIAYFFGAGPAADAFFVAFRIPNLLRRLFAEGTLTVAFVPVFTQAMTKEGQKAALRLARATATLLVLVLAGVCLAGMIWADLVVRVMAPGFTPGGESFTLAVLLTRWCLPFILLISLVALAGGVLNSLGHFFAPAAAPLLLNLSIIAAAVLLAPRLSPAVLSLAWGVLIGGVAQVLLQVPYLRARGVGLTPAWEPGNPWIRRILRLMGPAALGAAVYQIAVFINTVLASLLPTGSVSYLYYADRLIQFPLGVFAFAVTTAILPTLSRQAANNDLPALIESTAFGLRLTWFVTVPAMVGICVLAQPLVVLLYARGQFGPDSVTATTQAVWGYGVGLWAFAGTRSVVQAFYALKDTRTPVKVAAASLVVNVGLSLWLMHPLGHAGLALATSLAAATNLAGLAWLLHRRLGRLGWRRVAISLGWVGLASLAMALASAAAVYLPDWGSEKGMGWRVVRPLAGVTAGALAYLGTAWALRLPELGELGAVLGRRMPKSPSQSAPPKA